MYISSNDERFNMMEYPNIYDGTQYEQPYQTWVEYIHYPLMYKHQPDSPTIPATINAQKQTKPQTEPRMSKAEALAFIRSCKKWIVVAALVGFGILSGLAGQHMAETATQQSTSATNTSATSPSSGGFFQQQQGGYGFGTYNPAQSPFSSSRVS
jgi:hypothetical protein